MRYEVELKIISDDSHRFPDNTTLMIALDKYLEGFKGVIVFHDSVYDYKYNIDFNKYYNVDKLNVIGHVFDVNEKNDGKIYLSIETNEELNLQKRYICFFRATMQNDIKIGGIEFNRIVVHAIDLIKVIDSDNVPDDNVSNISIISS